MRSDACDQEVHGSCRGDAYRRPSDTREPCTCPCHAWDEYYDPELHDPRYP